MANSDIIASLNPVAADAARAFLLHHPDGILTSGRRSVKAQADAMAADCAVNPQFIQQTYAKANGRLVSAAAQACQDWMNAQASCPTGDVICAAFEGILGTFSAEDLEHLSLHLGGNAFDCHVDDDPAKLDTLKTLASNRVLAGGKALFLEEEAGLPRWHWQGV